jgi:hypothetical protein
LEKQRPLTNSLFFLKNIQPIIQAFGSNVNVYKLSEPTTADVRYTLNKKPFVAVLDSSGFNEIQIGYLLSAGFENGTHFQVMSKEQANSFDSGVCVSLATEPHFESVRLCPFAVHGLRVWSAELTVFLSTTSF